MRDSTSYPYLSNPQGYDPNAPIFIPATGTAPSANNRPWIVSSSVLNTSHTSEQLVVQTAVNNPSEKSQLGLLESLQSNGFRTDVASTGARSTVLTNFLSIKQRPTTLFVYTIEFIKGFDDHEKPVSVKHKFDRQGLFDSMVNDTAYVQLQQNAHKWVTDFYNIWSAVPLFHDIDYTRVPNAIPIQGAQNPNSGKRISNVEVAQIIFHRTIDLQKTIGQLYSKTTGGLKGNTDAALLSRGLNAIITRHATNTARQANPTLIQSGAYKFYQTARSFELVTFRSNIVKGLHGFFVSVRPGSQQLLLNVNLRCSPFLKGKIKAWDVINAVNRDFSQASAILRGVKVSIHASQQLEFVTSVENRFNGRSVNVGKDPRKHPGREQWEFPDKLQTAELSPYRQQLNPVQTSKMIKEALKRPSEYCEDIMGNVLAELGLQPTSTFSSDLARDFGIVVESKLCSVPCRFFSAPKLQYEKILEPRDGKGDWQLTSEKLFSPCHKLQVTVLDLTGLAAYWPREYVQPAEDFPERFEKVFRKAIASLGITLSSWSYPNHHIQQDSTGKLSEDSIYQVLQRQQSLTSSEKGIVAFIFLIPQKDYDLYAMIKRVADLRMGNNTTCLVGNSNVLKFHSNTSHSVQHCANVGLKLNLKDESGVNHYIERAKFIELFTPSDYACQSECDTIVIGADVTHPVGHCAPGCPSIAAVVGSVDDNFATFPGSMRLQRGRQEVIANLADMVKERLIDWAGKHEGRLPGMMLFYRDGVGENQFETVREKEISQVQQAYDMAYKYLNKESYATGPGKKESLYPFKVTFIIVGKRHNTRFFPQSLKDSIPNGNVKPGLVVDQVITHPYITDFYLMSHAAIQGTGKPAHYFVLKNGMALSSDRLQEITHAFCYNYARATRSVSYCAPAYYADRLCDRGRAYIRDWLVGRVNAQPHMKRDNESSEAHRDRVASFLQDSPYYNHHTALQKYGQPRKNPWHPDLDNKMFYL
ncbi:hypothetical protein WHR41_02002 [Cladosporium halotolerans]|uniref:Piwi domain-containing protein n=1 Tax=Cladosporium halotolerans TaxID=1052096 RepID=A0AB34KYS0_9PEZI